MGRWLTMEETIAAIATPPGEGGIGIIRISGTEALNIDKIFQPKIRLGGLLNPIRYI